MATGKFLGIDTMFWVLIIIGLIAVLMFFTMYVFDQITLEPIYRPGG